MNNALSTVLTVFVNNIIPIFIVIGAGYFGQKMLKMNLGTIARLGLYILSPCLAFSSLLHSSLSLGNSLGLIAIVLFVTAVLWTVVGGAMAVLRQSPRQSSGFLLGVLFMNAGNYGIPLLDLALGKEARGYGVVFFVTQQVLFNTLAVWLATRGQLGWRQAIRQVLRMPVTYAVPAAILVIVTGLPVPTPIDKAVSLLGDSALPIILLSLGIQLAETRPALSDAPRIATASLFRLVLSPALAALAFWWFGASLFGMSSLAGKVAIIEAGMPTAVTVVLMAIEFEADSKFVGGVVFFSTLASAVTLTVLLTLVL